MGRVSKFGKKPVSFTDRVSSLCSVLTSCWKSAKSEEDGDLLEGVDELAEETHFVDGEDSYSLNFSKKAVRFNKTTTTQPVAVLA